MDRSIIERLNNIILVFLSFLNIFFSDLWPRFSDWVTIDIYFGIFVSQLPVLSQNLILNPNPPFFLMIYQLDLLLSISLSFSLVLSLCLNSFDNTLCILFHIQVHQFQYHIIIDFLFYVAIYYFKTETYYKIAEFH